MKNVIVIDRQTGKKEKETETEQAPVSSSSSFSDF